MRRFRRFQFSIRTIAVAVFLLGTALALFVNARNQHQRLMHSLNARGFLVLDQAVLFKGTGLARWVPQYIAYLETPLEISEADLPLINGCHRLEYLSICDPQFNDVLLKQLGPFRYCKHLSLPEGQVTDDGLVSLVQSFPNLESLTIVSTKITGRGLAPLAKLPHFRRLDIHGDQLTSEAVDSLQSLPALEFISLGAGQVSDALFERLATQTGVQWISLGFCDVSPQAIDRAREAGLTVSFSGCQEVEPIR